MVLWPLLHLFSAWSSIDSALWHHLQQTLLTELIINTLTLAFWVALGTGFLGISIAWLVTRCEFAGRRWFEWTLFLPFAMPAYVLAFVFLGIFDYTGVLQSWLRDWGLITGGWDIRQNVSTLALTMSLVFYPYVYLLARSAFLTEPPHFNEVARTLGYPPLKSFFHLSLPLARPAIIAGLSLAIMEVLADFGTVAIFNYDTFTTAIYSSWTDFRSIETAAQLSTILIAFAVLLIALEQWQRGKKTFYSNKHHRPQTYPLKGWKAKLAQGYLTLILSLTFIIPVIQLGLWSWQTLETSWDARYYQWIGNSLLLAATAALITALLAFMMNLLIHNGPVSRLQKLSMRAITLGYALPGSVLAIGVMAVFIDIQQGLNIQLWLNTSLFALMVAYIIRFFAVANGPIESRFQAIQPSIAQSAQTLGASPLRIAQKIYWPLLKTGVLTAILLVGLDILKELPATYLLRPYGWDTLAVRTYELSAEGLYEAAAIPALLLLIIGCIGLILTERIRLKNEPKN